MLDFESTFYVGKGDLKNVTSEVLIHTFLPCILLGRFVQGTKMMFVSFVVWGVETLENLYEDLFCKDIHENLVIVKNLKISILNNTWEQREDENKSCWTWAERAYLRLPYMKKVTMDVCLLIPLSLYDYTTDIIQVQQ